MKKLIYILAGFFIYSITACNDKLDVNPQQNITPDQIKTADDVKALLFGEYSLWQNGNAFGEGFTFTADLLASENQINFVGTFTSYKDLKNKTQNSQNGIASAIWENAYQVINVSNTVIDKINLVNEDERDAIIAEAKFFRGVTFFELLNFYSQPYSMGNTDAANSGIPLMLEPQYNYDSTKAFVSRNTINECYAQIISDLTEAKNKLPEQSENFRATKYSAEAFLARVYLNMADYANAATAANDIIASENFNLTGLFNQAFNNDVNSSEDIFCYTTICTKQCRNRQ